MLRSYLRRFAHTLLEERDTMEYIFSQTEGDSQDQLTDRMDPDHLLAFLDSVEMLDWLTSIYVDANEKSTTRIKYRKLEMLPTETFNQFYSEFAKLATKGCIDLEESLDDLFHKLTPALHDSVRAQMSTRPTLKQALGFMQFHDNDLRLAKMRRQDERRARPRYPTTVPAVTSALPPLARSSSPAPRYASPLVSRERSAPTPTTVFHARTRSPTPSSDPAKATCFSCGTKGHFKRDCPQVSVVDKYDSESRSENDEPSGNGQP